MRPLWSDLVDIPAFQSAPYVHRRGAIPSSNRAGDC
jgi:hypothetical protein